MHVKEVMTSGVVTANPGDTVCSAVENMIRRQCGCIPVVNPAGDLLGILTLRDVLLPLFPNYGDYLHDNVHARDFEEMEPQYREVLKMSVDSVMTRRPFTVSPDEPVLKAASYMGLKNLRRIPVTEGRKLVGVITVADINRALFLHQSSEQLLHAA